ncbi:MAG: lysophospholipid acyltransferase family protein [Verrucomicrobiota bacterium]
MATRRTVDWLRAGGRLCGLLGAAFFAAAALLVCPRNRADARARAQWLQRLCARVLRVIGVRVRERGQPVHGALIAANHLGYIDILVLSALTPVVFVAKREVRGWPLFGWFAARAGTRFIDRGKPGDVVRVGGELTALIADGLSVLVFLEGTSSDGRQVLPFKPSLLEPAVRGGWPVAAAALDYAVPPGRSVENEVAWWGDMTLPPHLANFLTLPWVEARVSWGEPRPADMNRKELAAVLREDVLSLRGLRAASVKT